jgi:hypothetical protein
LLDESGNGTSPLEEFLNLGLRLAMNSLVIGLFFEQPLRKES